MEFESGGRLPEELVQGATPDPAPEYIEAASEPSPEAWDRERQARNEIEEERGES